MKKSCSPCQYLSKNIWHSTYKLVNQDDSRLLMVVSQIGTLTPDPSFDHNLCFNNSNGSCKPILDINVSKTFPLYKELFNPMSFDL